MLFEGIIIASDVGRNRKGDVKTNRDDNESWSGIPERGQIVDFPGVSSDIKNNAQ